MALSASSLRAATGSWASARAPARRTGAVAVAPRSRTLAPVIRATAGGAKSAPAAAPVKIILQGRRLEVTPAIRDYVEEKISRAVHNYAPQVRRIDVTISARGGDTGTHGAKQQKVDVTIHTLRDGLVRVEDAESSLYASIDVVCDKVRSKLRKMKEKAITKGRWAGGAGARGDDEDDFKKWVDSVNVEIRALDAEQAMAAELAHLNRAASPAGIPETVLRSKVLRVDRMPVDDAIDAMEAVGHAFFLFRDTASGEVNVVYKRSAGGYGVLIPEADK